MRHLVLLGLMGSGKTTVGRLLAGSLGVPLRDSDAWIMATTGRTARGLRDELGVDAMHDLERRHLLESLAEDEPTVVAAAASIIDDGACREALRTPGVALVWLRASPAVAAARFRAGSHRPWYGDDPEAFLARQAARRDPLFRALNPIRIRTDDRGPDAVAAAALAALARRA